MNIRNNWTRLVEGIRFRFAPKVATWMAHNSTFRARQRLRKDGPIAVLVDNTVLDHSVTHETAWISTGVKKWGPHDVQTGYQARIAVHPADSTSEEYRNIQFLPGIAHLARRGFILLKTSAELNDEQFRQPVGRFRGYGYFDYSLFSDIKMESVDGFVGPTLGPRYLNLPSAVEQQRERLGRSDDSLYAGLVQLLGNSNSQDAWHIRTAEVCGLFCFLSMDFSLMRCIRSRRNQEPLKSLKTRIMTPVEFGHHFGMLPVPPHVFAYTNASSPVRSDVCWPDGQRRRRRNYRKEKS